MEYIKVETGYIMKFLYIKINNWFELDNTKYKKIGGSFAKKNDKGEPISFLKSTQVERCDPPAKIEKPKKNTPVKNEDFIEEEKDIFEELND